MNYWKRMDRFWQSLIRIALLVLMVNSYSFCQDKSSKIVDKLKLIQSQIEDKEKELEKYINLQEELKWQLKNLKKEEEETNTAKQLISQKLKKNSEEILIIKNRYDTLKNLYNTLLQELKNEVTFLYLKKFSFSDYYGTDTLVYEVISRNIIVGKSMLAKTLNMNTQKTGEDIKRLFTRKQEIVKEKEMIEEKIRKNKMALTDANIKMRKNKKMYNELKQEIEDLKKSASELTKLIKRLEKNSPYKKSEIKELSIPKNSLSWPIQGTVISKFGKEYVAELKTWVVRNGIKIKASGDLSVRAIERGKVIFSGPFRNYGNIVIISHDNDFYSIYGFLKEIYATNGATVDETSIIGLAGEDIQSLKEKEKNVLYLEIRVGEDAVDPLVWLKK